MITPLVRLISCSALRSVGLRCSAVRMACSKVKVGTLAVDAAPLRDILLLTAAPSVPANAGPPKMPNVARIPTQRKNLLIQPLAIRRRKAGRWIQRSLITLPPTKEKSFRLTIIVNLAVNVEPRLLLVRCEVIQYFHQVADHLLTNAPHQSRPFRCDAHHHFAAVISSGRAYYVAEILQARHQSAGGCRGVPHFLCHFRHGEHFFAVEISEKKKLRERHVT